MFHPIATERVEYVQRNSLLSLLLLAVACGPAGHDGLPMGQVGGPTYQREIRPLFDQHCNGCHAPGGVGGLVLDGSPALTPLILSKVDAGLMPPWPPGPLSPALVNDISLSAQERDLLHAWAAGGSPAGNAEDYHPQPAKLRPQPSLTLHMSAPFQPARGQADQYRCFVLSGLAGGWITALTWQLGHPAAAHHVGGIVVDAAGLALLHSRGLDGPSGFDCPGGFGPAPALAGLSSTGTGPAPGFELPSAAGIRAPGGGAIVMQIHYVPDAVPAGGDLSGVALWIDSSPRRPVVEFQFAAPVEVPCGTGVSRDPSNRCSRQWALDHDGLRAPAQSQSDSDLALARCGQSLSAYYQHLPWQSELRASFLIPTECTSAFPVSGSLLGVHVHMHTRGVSGRIEVQRPDGSWQIALDIPRWRWPWEAAYLLRDPMPVRVGQAVRVSCVIDNGTAAQWGAGGPGHDAPAVPPLDLPAYHVGGSSRDSEMCAAFLQIEKDN